MKIQKEQIKVYCIITLGMNIASIVLGLLHYIIGLNIVFGIMFSVILGIVWVLNIGLLILNDFKIVKSNPIGKKLNLLGYGFIGFQIIAIFTLAGGIFLLNADWTTPLVQYLLIGIGFFGYFIYGSIFSYINIKKVEIREVWKFE